MEKQFTPGVGDPAPNQPEHILPTEGKCPFSARHTPAGGPGNANWWPNQLNLKILHQRSPLSDPMDKRFNYAEEFKRVSTWMPL